MQKFQDILSHSSLRASAKQSSGHSFWIASALRPRNDEIKNVALVALLFLLAACAEKPEVTPYDYDTREKAKIDLPRNTSMDIDTDEFVVKKKFRLPDWMK